MKKITANKILDILYRGKTTPEQDALDILDLFYTPLKPLSELEEEKLKWYKKLRMKLDRIIDEELGLYDYREEVSQKIKDMEKRDVQPETKTA